MLAAILAAIRALPMLLEEIKALREWLAKSHLEEWIRKSNEAFDKLEKAKTPEEKQDAAKDIGSLIRHP